MGNMREISIEECNAVFGGTDEVDEIVVTGTKKVSDSNSFSDSLWSFGGGSYTTSYGAGSGGAIDYVSLFNSLGWENIEEGEVDEGDDDGDGILNRDEEIVVTSALTHSEVQFLNQAAAWYQWGQNVAFSLTVGGGLMTTSLTEGGQLAAGVAIGGAANVPSLNDAQYQANWNILYYQMQVDRLRENNANPGLNPGLNMY